MKVMGILLTFFSCACFANYTGNHSSKVNSIKIYNIDTIYIMLETMPVDHKCAENYFVLSPTLTESQRNRYYSMLLAAKSSGGAVSVGYDKINPDCINGRPVVHAISY